MKSVRGIAQICVIALAICGLTILSVPALSQTQPASPMPSGGTNVGVSGACGNQPLCFEANDFTATITDFRTSVAQDGWGTKLIDMLVHFRNKTNQPLNLGYADGSGYALDDRGNRYSLNSNGGVRGMGVVAGNNLTPQFTLAPGGSGDARFELWWHPGSAIVGQIFEVGLDIREINVVEGNQYVLGNDTLMHYTGLVNGVAVASGSSQATGAGTPASGATTASQSQPCQTTASNAVQQGTSSATSALSSVTSALSHTQSPASTASTVAGSVPCVPSGASGLVNSLSTVAPAVGNYANPQNNGTYGTTNQYAAPGAYGTPTNYNAPATYSAPASYGTAVPVQPTSGTVPAQPVSTNKTATQPVTATTTVGQPVPASKVTPIPTSAPVAHAQPVPAAKPVPVAKTAAKPAAQPAKKPPQH